MSHTSSICIRTSNCTEVIIRTGSRQLAEFAGVPVNQSIELNGEDAANFIHRPRLSTLMSESEYKLVMAAFSVEQEWEDHISPEVPAVSHIGYSSGHVHYAHFSVTISHHD